MEVICEAPEQVLELSGHLDGVVHKAGRTSDMLLDQLMDGAETHVAGGITLSVAFSHNPSGRGGDNLWQR